MTRVQEERAAWMAGWAARAIPMSRFPAAGVSRNYFILEVVNF